ncbi:MAG: TonB-dependent receptor [Chitinophagaceae bacterium]|nr:TonB-dependent receptor [Chitinophagaceae bacterium]
MRTLTLIAAFLFAGLFTMAQMPGGIPGNMPAGGAPNMGHVYGKLTDTGGKPVAGASVMLMQKKMDSASKKMKDILLKAMITKSNGEFNFEELPVMASLTLKISNTGFTPYQTSVSFLPKTDIAKMPATGTTGIQSMPGGIMPSFDKDLGNIQLINDSKELQNVTITSVTQSIKLSADKKVFNVEKNIMSAGGTGLDVMRNVPSVNVDIDGNVTVRNTAPQLLVDGRPTTLTLDQIPADVIESVEVITNPSAKYDASGGGGGILNVVLKKNKKTGYNGNLRTGVDKRGALNGGADFSLRQNKFNFSASVNGNQNKGRTTGTTDRQNLLTVPLTSIYQDNYNKTQGGFLFGKIGIDYFISNRTTLSLSGIRVHGEFRPNETIDISTDSLFTSGKISSTSQRITAGAREFNGRGLVFGLKHLFKKEGEEFTIDANYFTGKNENSSLYTTSNFSNDGSLFNTGYEKVNGNGSDKNFVIQSDFVLPFMKTYKLETGVRAAIRSRINHTYNYVFDDPTNDYVIIPSATSNYKNTDNVYAAYATISNTIKNFSYKVGLRAERSDYNGTLTNSGDQFKNSYPVSLFPSLFVSQKLTNSQELQFSVTRRVNRPNFFQLIPFVDYSDKLNITQGNPGLKPEFTFAYEVSYLKNFSNKNTLLGSVYYKHSTNLITRYLTQQINPFTGNTDIINSYINANSSYAAGAELTSVNYLTKWWDISTNVNAYNSKINTSNISNSTSQPALWSWFSKFNSNFKLPANFAIQLTTTYQSKTNLPVSSNQGMGGPPWMQSQSASQGYIKANWGMDIAFKKSFLKNNAASVSLNISDIFRTRINSQYTYSDYFTQQYTRLRDPQMFRINFSYRFGKIDASLFKRKSTKGEQNAAESIQN